MQLTSVIFTLSLSLASVVTGAAVIPRKAQDVFVPPIICPNSKTVWTMGTNVTVTWDPSSAPVNISNGASVELKGYGCIAKGFDLRSGHVDVYVPFVDPAVKFWRIILFGDSGNESQDFRIVPNDAVNGTKS